MKLTSDLEAWNIVDPEDLWVFDKLLLSKRLGYVCGPKGEFVPKPSKYIVRPCVNLLGMGRGAKVIHLKDATEYNMADGTFWCELFKGKHLSVDYQDGRQILCVEGVKLSASDMQRWKMWRKTSDKPRLPKIINILKNKYKYFNVEMIGGKIIEIHLRLNPDFQDHDSPYVIPVYKEEEIMPNRQQQFVMSPDEDRVGFYIRR
jgi:hypothetical protein